MKNSLSNREAVMIIGLLVERLGGEVIITREQVIRADDLELESLYRPEMMHTRITARRKPVTLQGETVPDAPHAIEPPPACRHPFDVQHWTFEGDMICGSCGATTGHDEQMRVRSINAGLIE